ncbi:MAG: glutathione S-transferase family protein [Proteobacteria bacterium]|nr:glutathione S-transferase family protein [Pseudomonadota bacterium]
MIRLHGFGAAFGLPDPSPFVTKVEVLLKMAGLPYEKVRGDFRKAPKGKLPMIEDKGKLIADSTLIRFYLEREHGVDFNKGVSATDAAAAWAFEKMCEDHLYWIVVKQRWLDDANFERGPAIFFKSIPALLRPLIVGMIRRKVKRNLFGQGFGRMSDEEGRAILSRAYIELAAYLEGRAYLGGAQPCGSDATVFAFLMSTLVPTIFEGYPTEEAKKHPALAAYVERMKALYYPGGLAA